MPEREIYDDPTDIEKVDSPTFGDRDTGPGELLKKGSPETVAKKAIRLWEALDDHMNHALARWQVNELRREGWKNVRLRRESDDMSYFCWTSPAAKGPDETPIHNKAATLCRKLTSIMFADPPQPDARPDSGDEDDRDAAEVSTRILEDLDSPLRAAITKKARRAFDRSHTYDSGFVRVMVDAYHTKQVMEVQAPVSAETVDDIPEDFDSEMFEWVPRYVDEQGNLVNDPSDAATQFVPGIELEVLTGRNVRLLPHTAEDITEAYGVMIAGFQTWGELKRKLAKVAPELENLDKPANHEKRDKLFRKRPSNYADILTREEKRTIDLEPENADERMVYTQWTYFRATPHLYPNGACVLTLGDMLAPIQEEWVMEDDQGREIALPLPLAQFKGYEEGQKDPYGFGTMHIVGNANELRGNLIAAWLDNLDAILNRKIFVPTNSILKAKDMRLPGRTMIPVNPGGVPSYEEVPNFPQDGLGLFNTTTQDMENDVAVTGVAQGLESAQVQSGRHANAIVSQVHASLSELRQNVEEGYERLNSVILMMVRAFFDVPQTLSYESDDGAYKVFRWTGSDLRNTTDVKLKPGSLSLMGPIQKSIFARQLFEIGVLDQYDFVENTRSAIGGITALQDNPFLNRIRRQIAAWNAGPPEGWQPTEVDQPQLDPLSGEPMVGLSGLPVFEKTQVMDPVLLGIFQPLPADEEPFVALMRLRELAKAMSRSSYQRHPPGWQFGILQEYGRAQLAATPGGLQPGQPPASPSPAQLGDGPLAGPETPLPDNSEGAELT